jgi:hypothetical protein
MAIDREQSLSRICVELERLFPGTVAAFSDFVTSYLGGPRDGFDVIEIFRVAEEQVEDVLVAAEKLARDHFDRYGVIIAPGIWTQEETDAFFMDDLRSIEHRRKPAWALSEAAAREWQPDVQLTLLSSDVTNYSSSQVWRHATTNAPASEVDPDIREAA